MHSLTAGIVLGTLGLAFGIVFAVLAIAGLVVLLVLRGRQKRRLG